MKGRVLGIVVGLLCLLGMLGTAAAATTAADFATKLDLSPIDRLAVQNNQTIKTMDSYARQTLTAITGHSALDGHTPLYTVLDMAIRPDAYKDRNIIKIQNVPLRMEFRRLQSISSDERERIVKTGLISLSFYRSGEVQQLMQDVMAADLRKGSAVQQVEIAAGTLAQALMGRGAFPPLMVVPPATEATTDKTWHTLNDIQGNVPDVADWMAKNGMPRPVALPNYEGKEALFRDILQNAAQLSESWKAGDATAVNESAKGLAQLLPQVNPNVYPSETKRAVEVMYNKLAKMTLPGAFVYFIAFVCFLVAARSGVTSVHLWGLRLFVLAFVIHTLGIGIRWWLISSSVGGWFDAIPIKNMFESIMFSSWFGALVGLILEFRRGKNFFGAAACFVGCLAMVALFTVPLMIRDIGQEIGQVNGVLMSYWLYIHVTMVTASYALIGMGFLLSAWWLIKYYGLFGAKGTKDAYKVSSDAASFDEPLPISGGGAVASLGFAQTLAMMLFVPVRKPEIALKTKKAAAVSSADAGAKFLATLDLCNLVVLQLAFWVLGAGIICGAVWADQSWGRPWGWDPKETFALVTWIVYLIVVHVRVATEDKAWWTAVLSIIGFFIMLFNWIGVNFFLVGLHSYA